MGTTHTTQSVNTPAAPLDLNKFASLKADAWWLTMTLQTTPKSTADKVMQIHQAIAYLVQMQTMLTREYSRILQEDNELTEQERYMLTVFD